METEGRIAAGTTATIRTKTWREGKKKISRGDGNLFVAHFHTKRSVVGGHLGAFTENLGITPVDSLLEPRGIVEWAVKNGVRILMPTDHDSILGYWEMKQYIIEKRYDILLIPAVEFTTKWGHLLIVGIEYDEGNEEVESISLMLQSELMNLRHFNLFSMQIRERGGYCIPAHPLCDREPWVGPYFNGKELSGDFLNPYHGIEAYNAGAIANVLLGVGIEAVMDRVGEMAPGLFLTGADAHRMEEMMHAYMIVECNLSDFTDGNGAYDFSAFLAMLTIREGNVTHILPPWAGNTLSHRIRRLMMRKLPELYFGVFLNQVAENGLRRTTKGALILLTQLIRERKNPLRFMGVA
jgi:hypothetical protein